MGDDSYTSRVDFDNEKFYNMLDEFDGIPVTSQITAFEYQETFEKLYQIETGLYLESAAYVYGIFQDERNFGKIVQAEI